MRLIDMPIPVTRQDEKVKLSDPGVWIVLSDAHIPHHDTTTVEAAVKEAQKRKAVGFFINGDWLDCADLSQHDRDVDTAHFRTELSLGKQGLGYIRSRLPKARIVYKPGNHEERLPSYLTRLAPALHGIEGVDLPSFLDLAEYGVEWVKEKLVVMLGKLNIIHGHEYGGGGSKRPASWLLGRAHRVSMCGHFHRTDEAHERDIQDYNSGSWATGCACNLRPFWLKQNNWNHGFAVVEIDRRGDFEVQNKRIIHGKAV